MHRSATRNGMYGGKRWIPITAIILIFWCFPLCSCKTSGLRTGIGGQLLWKTA